MLVSAQKLTNTPVASIRSGGIITRTTEIIVDPDQLKVIAFRCQGGLAPTSGANLLSVKSIREYSMLGFIIDDADELIDQSEIVRIDQVLQLNFALPGLKVETKKGAKLGKITNFVVNTDDFFVQQIIVHRPAIKSFLDPELVISRQEIVEVTDYKVIVKDEKKTLKKPAEKKDFVPNFVNPFRNPEQGFAPIDTKNPDDIDKQ